MEARFALGTGIQRKDRPRIMPLAFAASCRGRRSWPASHSNRGCAGISGRCRGISRAGTLPWAILAPVPLALWITMSLEQLRAFLVRMQQDESLKQQVLAAATADDVAQIALGSGYEFSGDELLRVSGQRFDRVTVRKNDLPGEYN